MNSLFNLRFTVSCFRSHLINVCSKRQRCSPPFSRGRPLGETATERRDASQDRIYEMASSVFFKAHSKRDEE